MSPIPPVAENHDGSPMQAQYNQDFSQSAKNLPATQNGCNGSSQPPQKDEPVTKGKRGRPAKNDAGQIVNGTVKKRGRPPKIKTDEIPNKQSKITDSMKKAKRTVNRFKDVTKEELMERFLPDRIKPDLDILIIGINPGLFAAYKGHHYAGPGNHFWSCLNMSGFVDRKMTSDDDAELLNYGIGFSTIVQRTTPAAKDLSSKEIREGAKKLIEKIQQYKPKIAVFNGKGIYEIFSKEIFAQKKKDFSFGTQENKIPGTETYIYVMASSSARCAQFPRAQDKVHFYVKLKQLRDKIKGLESEEAPVCEVGYTFDLKKATELAKIQNIKQERIDPEYENFDGTKNGTGNSFPMDQTDSNNNHLVEGEKTLPQISGATSYTTNTNNNAQTPAASAKKVDDVSLRHSHLIRYLRQVNNPEEPGPSHARQSPVTLSPANPKLQQDVSEEQRQERVGNWVREQQSLEYDSEPPMGIEERELSGDGGSNTGVELDQASQLSTISAGVSGSASESTSGYGSVDASSRRVRLDRVEMWVMEQQHVRRGNPAPQQLQQSLQVASTSNTIAQSTSGSLTPQNPPRFQHAPSVSWFQGGYPQVSSLGMLHTPLSIVTAAGGTQPMFSMAGRKSTPVGPHQINVAPDPGAGLSTAPTSSVLGGRNSPYRMTRTGSRREGGSSSSFGTVRPPVPLYSTWGGEGSGSGGSVVSSPVVPFVNPPTPPSTNQFAGNSNNSNNVVVANPGLHHIGGVWNPVPGGGSLLTPYNNV